MLSLGDFPLRRFGHRHTEHFVCDEGVFDHDDLLVRKKIDGQKCGAYPGLEHKLGYL